MLAYANCALFRAARPLSGVRVRLARRHPARPRGLGARARGPGPRRARGLAGGRARRHTALRDRGVSGAGTMARKARIVVIGAGWWAAVNHIPLLLKNAGLRAGRGLPPRRRRAGQAPRGLRRDPGPDRGLPGPAGRDQARRRRRHRRPHVDHYEHAKAALEAGCHVLVEKPLTTSAADARDLVALRPGRRPARSSCPMAGTSSPTSATPACSSRAAPSAGSSTSPCRWPRRSRTSSPAQPDGRDRGRAVPPAALDLGRPQARRRLRLGPARPRARPPLPRRRPRAGRGLRPHRPLAGRRRLLRRRRGPLRGWRHRPLSGAATVPKHRGFQLDLRSSAPRACCSSTSSASAWRSAAATATTPSCRWQSGDGAYSCEEPPALLVDSASAARS